MTESKTLDCMEDFVGRFLEDLAAVYERMKRRREMEYSDRVLRAVAESKIALGELLAGE